MPCLTSFTWHGGGGWEGWAGVCDSQTLSQGEKPASKSPMQSFSDSTTWPDYKWSFTKTMVTFIGSLLATEATHFWHAHCKVPVHGHILSRTELFGICISPSEIPITEPLDYGNDAEAKNCVQGILGRARQGKSTDWLRATRPQANPVFSILPFVKWHNNSSLKVD